MAEPLVTAIVSTWSAERFMAGCLEDLLAQTMADRIEILVVDACSPQNEGDIVRRFQQSHANVRYVRTAEREASSRTFNRAIGLARGRYLTTANTDDRHRPDFFERMTGVLERHPEFALVYADSWITTHANETFATHTATRRYAWPDYTHTTALSCCLFGAQPVWRRDVHAVVGHFDEACLRANDQDMFVRIAARFGAVHLAETLGLFLARPDSVSGADHRRETLAEVLAVLRRHRTGIPLNDLFPALRAPTNANDALAHAAALFEMGNLCALGPYNDGTLALDFWRRAIELPLGTPHVARIRCAYANNTGCVLAAAGERDAASRALRLAGDLPEAAHNRSLLAAAPPAQSPRLRDLAYAGIPHAVVTDSRRTRGLKLAPGGGYAFTPAHEQLPWNVYDGPDGVVRDERTWTLPTPHAATPSAQDHDTPEHVLLVMYGWADSGGGTILPRQFALALAARGHRVSVVYAAARAIPDLPPYGVHRTTEGGVALHGICNRPTAFMDLAAPEREIDDERVRTTFAALLDELAPEVVHFFNLHNLGMSLPAECRARAIPTLFSSNNYWPICPRLYLASERLDLCTGASADGTKCERCLGQTGTAAAHAARRRAGLAMLDDAIDLHLATSHRVRDLYVGAGADPARIRVLQQQPPTVDAIWERIGSRRVVVDRLSRPLRVAFVGSVLPHKGVHVLAAALQQIPPGAVECVVLGDQHKDYVAHLRGIDARHALHFVGGYPQQALPELLAKVDVVVVPSVWDDCAPLVVAEALAARAPVVGSRIGGIPDFVTDGANGFLFTPGDGKDLARCLAAFTTDPTLLGRMQAAIEAPRGFAAYVDDVLATYRSLPVSAPLALKAR